MKARPVLFGEILFDRFPDGKAVLGGAPFNVAWHLQAFGESPLMLSRVGDDDSGRQLIKTMQSWGMTVQGIQVDAVHPTGVVNVTLQETEPSYDIVVDSAYDFIDERQLPSLDNVAVLYHGSLASRNQASREALQALKSRHREACFVDINLRSPHYNEPVLQELIRGASWLKLNEAEFTEVFAESPAAGQATTDRMQELDLQNLVITRGADGAEIRTSNGKNFLVKPTLSQTVVDSVGAGDAFSSVLLLGLVNHWPLEQTLERAHDFAQKILGIRGATVDDREFYRPFIVKWGLDRTDV